ncbi:hypothetical protein CSV72_04490 [Sporosarcina sp. P20a]|uniref:PilW family protein n=1 Tax=Sporosarcina sp. P20a TaxID=2048256 RepID=UPI000C16DFFA|nr:prepilin-type N-terminal cleavage/methylation domain-containing protein [Sporosarcina sp. P20a]PIC87238.1 hypothetical protein CSV72_04490 [Sporosarcina sp. P20a]
MKKNEEGMTLVEVLATLTLLSIVTGILWATVSIASQFNVSETSVLRLQQESNYIISQLQQTHRQCYTYRLTISYDEVKVTECMKDKEEPLDSYNGVISNQYHYGPNTEEELINPTKAPYELSDFTVFDSIVNSKRQPRQVVVSTILSRYITEDPNKTNEGS